MELTVGTEEQYTESLKKLLPQGSYWDKIKSDSASDINRILAAMGNDIRYFRSRMAQLQKEAYPATAEETLENWERVRLGTTNPTLATENRRALILGNAGFSAIYKIAENFGVQISVEFPFRCGCFGWQKFGQKRLGAQNTLSVVTVSVLGGENLDTTDDFEAAITGHLLANHIISFKYIFAGGKTFSDMDELSKTVKIDLTPNHSYTPARFGRAVFGQSRIAAPFMADVALVLMQGYRSTWKRKDVETAVLDTAGKYEKICFAYGADIFYGGCKAIADGHTFSTLAELSEHTGVELTESKPYEAARFGQSRSASRLTSPFGNEVTFIKIGGYGADFRRTDIETATMEIADKYSTVYFVYGKSVIWGGKKASASGLLFHTLEELSEHTGVELKKTMPFQSACFGRDRFGESRLASPRGNSVVLIRISGYGADWRRTDIESAALALQPTYSTVYFQYGKEAIYGGYVSR
ncbi:MAG: DUF2313 domain-containing protein [Treponema sp.]|nr:DUF2313 domain-containing protein [Treponema sp.]